MSVDFDLLHTQIERHLKKIEELLPPSYNLTLLARCTAEDLDDADIMLTVDTLPDIERAIEKRKINEINGTVERTGKPGEIL